MTESSEEYAKRMEDKHFGDLLPAAEFKALYVYVTATTIFGTA